MAKSQERIRARHLRKCGHSIGDIARILNVSKSSVSLWCTDLVLTRRQKTRIQDQATRAGAIGRLMGARMNHEAKVAREKMYRSRGIHQVGKMTKRDIFIAGIGFYWGEGTKKDKNTVSFINSDPEAIDFMYHWFQDIIGIPKKDFMPRIFINALHKPRKKKVLNFWSDLLDLPPSQFGKIVFIKVKQKKVYENYHQYYGTLALRIRRSANLRYMIWGFIDGVKKGIA